MKLESEVRTLEGLLEQYKPTALLLDACGVFLERSDGLPLPGAQNTMARLKQMGIAIGVLSNASTTGARQLARIAQYGWQPGVHFDFYLTSGDVARSFLANAEAYRVGTRYFEIGAPHPQYGAVHRVIMDDLGILPTTDPSQASFAVANIPHEAGQDIVNRERLECIYLNDIERAIHVGLPLLSINPDIWVLEGSDSAKLLRQGAIAEIYQRLAGTVIALGKPSAIAFSSAIANFASCQQQRIWMVGDNPATDIRGARALGLETALVSLTGVFQEGTTSLPSEDTPSLIIERLAFAEFL